MIIGLPKALEYYRNEVLWRDFFDALDIKTVVSGETTRAILDLGVKYSIDESCLSSKIYMGHVASLAGKCDKILVPRLDSIGKNEYVCTKFNALFDIVSNIFDTKVIGYNIDVRKGFSEENAFVNIGKTLGKGAALSRGAYHWAKKKQKHADELKFAGQRKLLFSDKIKILIVAHDYNIYDSFIGRPLINMFNDLGAEVILACESDKAACIKLAKALSPTLFWRYNKEIIGAIELYGRYIDGAVFLTTFPCGPDSLVNELMLRRCADRFPAINIIVDEHQSETGLLTRTESFFDLLSARRNINHRNSKTGTESIH